MYLMTRDDMDADLKTAIELLLRVCGSRDMSYSKRLAVMRLVRALVLGVIRAEKNNRGRARDLVLKSKVP